MAVGFGVIGLGLLSILVALATTVWLWRSVVAGEIGLIGGGTAPVIRRGRQPRKFWMAIGVVSLGLLLPALLLTGFILGPVMGTSARDAFLGLAAVAQTGWLLIELRHAARSGEFRLFRMSNGEGLDRQSRPVFFWASFGGIVFVVMVLSMVAIGLLFGVELRWWL